ncbi:transcriptional regulator [Paenibacillus yonginensis]|uniref:Transcriptional regulator n=1 Tax=Paenibacillus yonginensis TaxID=1462996 RepID=A0A1B1MZ82_9BACL|nr:ROK family protein [Paenibacillus yonginensis]ANS74469.1 transcriptional regulator [Paenibacillus yonginensis]
MNPIVHNTIQVKKMNQELVRQALKTMKQGTKSMVAQATGLSIATCGNLLNELQELGELIKLDVEESSGGRPAKLYRYNVDFSYIACLIIKSGEQAHSITYTVANLAGETIEKGYQENKRMDPAVIHQLVDRLIELFPQIRAVGIGVPGAVNQGIVNISEIQELMHVPLEAPIRDKHGVEVIVENDMNLTVYGYYQKQDYEEEETVVVATFDQGCFPGAGIMVNGHIHRGSTRFAGEISFLPFGMSSEEQFRQLHDRATFYELVGRAVSSLTAVLNPKTVALTGSLVFPSDIDRIRQECRKSIPDMHMPQLTLLEHPDEDYGYGLITMTLESLAYSLRIVDKRR